LRLLIFPRDGALDNVGSFVRDHFTPKVSQASLLMKHDGPCVQVRMLPMRVYPSMSAPSYLWTQALLSMIKRPDDVLFSTLTAGTVPLLPALYVWAVPPWLLNGDLPAPCPNLTSSSWPELAPGGPLTPSV
jgi:hypothetical protein